MKRYKDIALPIAAAAVAATLALGSALAGDHGDRAAVAGAPDPACQVARDVAAGLRTADAILLAQGEGDIDESYDAHGADIDEEMEMDTAKMPADSAKKRAAAPAGAPAPTSTPAKPASGVSAADVAALTRGVRWFGQSAFLIQDGKNIYIDPFDLGAGLPPADLILITHDHSDHFSPEDIKKIIQPSTTIVSVGLLRDKFPKSVAFKAVKPGDTLTVQGVRIEAVPAYNTNKPFHPKERGMVGFIVHTGGRSFYHAGDTDVIPEMKDIKADVAFLPVGGKYTMDASEAAYAANMIQPKVAIPMHWGKVVGSAADAQTFKSKAKVLVVILEAESKQPEGGSKAK